LILDNVNIYIIIVLAPRGTPNLNITANRVHITRVVLLLKVWPHVKTRARTGRLQDVGRAGHTLGFVIKTGMFCC